MTGVGTIYGVKMKFSDAFCYVGQTRLNPKRRWQLHQCGKTALSQTLQMFGPETFDFVEIEQVPIDQLNERERYWIRQLNTLHPNGLNCTKGGSNGHRTAATKRRMSAAKKVACADPEYRAELSVRAKALWSTPEGRAKRRALWTDEKRAKVSDRSNELAANPEYRAKVAAGTKAALAKPEHRANQLQGIKRRWASPEERARQSARLKAFWAAKRAEKLHASAACA